MRTGGQVLADGLVAHGSELAFCVPGESYLALLDGLYEHRDALRIVNCRHEGAAANAADAYGKLTGRPGLCLVTRGPGATHAAVGVHTAQQDSTPLLLLVGQVARARARARVLPGARLRGRVRADGEVGVRDRRPRAHPRGARARLHGGDERAAGPGRAVAARGRARGRGRRARRAALRRATGPRRRRPRWRSSRRCSGAPSARSCSSAAGRGTTASAEAFTRWALASGLPVGATFRRQDVVDNTCASYAGDVGIGINPRLAQRIRDCDLLIAVGTRLTEIETQGYTLPAPPVAPQPLVHVHPDAGELGRVYQPALAVLSGVAEFAAAAPVVDGARWAEWTAAARADYEAWLEHAGGARRRRRPRRGRRAPARRAARRRDPHQRRGELLRLGRALLPVAALRHPARAAERRDGLRRPGGAGRAAAAPRPARDRVRRRRRLPDVRAGARHRGRRRGCRSS